jgi:hypothetical protein
MGMENEEENAVREKGENSEEANPVKFRKLGSEPTQMEIDEHNMDHSVFRAWCPHCVKGKSNAYPHRKIASDNENGIPTVSLDYMFMADKQEKEEEKGMPTLVMKDSRTKIIFAQVVPEKGRNPYAILRARKDLDSLGYKRVILKSDNENPIKALKETIKNESAVEVIMEESPVGDHAGNGEIESAIKQVQGQFRPMKDALDTRYGRGTEGSHCSIPWLMRHSAETINRRRKDDEGFTAYRRWKGREFKRPMAEFWENV